MKSGWTFAQGVHEGSGKSVCQDVCGVTACGDVLIASVADGAGSASHAGRGAEIVSQTFLELGKDLLHNADGVGPLLDTIRLRILQEAKASETSAEEFSSTLVGAVVAKDQAVFVQVGDGAAVLSDESGVRVAIEPEVTEFVNNTRFVTGPNAAAHVKLVRIEGRIASLALFSDGLQHLVLDAKNEPHHPFFQAAFGNLSSKAGHDQRASAWVKQTLASDPVTRRTDDDTSLVIARRADE